MTDETKQDQASRRELPEPTESSNQWPKPLWLFFGIMIGWGATYMALESGDGRQYETSLPAQQAAQVSADGVPQDQVPEVDGRAVYARTCLACHQDNGDGVPGAFPPLAGSEWVNGDKMIPTKIVLKGLHMPITVKGQTFNSVMPPFESMLKDEEVAAVVKYIRTSWGNQNSEFPSKEEVAKLREELKAKTDPWTAEELKN